MRKSDRNAFNGYFVPPYPLSVAARNVLGYLSAFVLKNGQPRDKHDEAFAPICRRRMGLFQYGKTVLVWCFHDYPTTGRRRMMKRVTAAEIMSGTP